MLHTVPSPWLIAWGSVSRSDAASNRANHHALRYVALPFVHG